MRLPDYADAGFRTINQPAVLLSVSQTESLFTWAERHADYHFAKPADLFIYLRDVLHANNWYRVEKQGSQLLLIALVVEGSAEDELVQEFVRGAQQTHNWSWRAFRNHRKGQVKLTIVKGREDGPSEYQLSRGMMLIKEDT